MHLLDLTRWTIDCFRSDVGNALVTLGEGNASVAVGAGAETVEVVSADALDDQTNAAGWGHTVRAIYEDTSGDFQTLTKDLAGVGSVSAGVATFHRLVKLDLVAYGTGGSRAKGNIDLRIGSGGAVRGRIRAGRSSAELGQFVVPLGYEAVVDEAGFTLPDGNAVEIIVESECDPATGARAAGKFFTVPGCVFAAKGPVGPRRVPASLTLPERTLVRASAIAPAGATQVAGFVALKLRRIPEAIS